MTSYAVTYHVGQELPALPDYGDAAIPSGAFLIRDGAFVFRKTFTLGAQQVEALRGAKAKLWIMGYVDYTDMFGTRHRNGYARRWRPGVPAGQNNLVIEPTPGYNYDREDGRDRKDWPRRGRQNRQTPPPQPDKP